TITGSTFRNNRTTNASYGLGGAITIWDGADVTINRTTLEQNKAILGGALYNSFSTGVIQIAQNSLLNDNSADTGGAVYSTDGEVTIDHSTVRNNLASISGGGVSSWGGSLTVTSTTLDGNTVLPGGFSAGGGIDIAGGEAMLFNVTMSHNTADTGGGIYNHGLTTLTHVTFSDNSATDGGGIFYENGVIYFKNVLLKQGTNGTNCASPYGPSVLVSQGYNLSSDASCDFKQTGDLNNTDPLIGPLADNGGLTQTHLLLDGSPAIDAGQCTGLASDQRDLPRLQGSACDIGAVERQPGDRTTFVYLPLVLR
ncbi:MAG: choice-of-anchor Q domain-containing protein, partial [Chloroflexota bacterium]